MTVHYGSRFQRIRSAKTVLEPGCLWRQDGGCPLPPLPALEFIWKNLSDVMVNMRARSLAAVTGQPISIPPQAAHHRSFLTIYLCGKCERSALLQVPKHCSTKSSRERRKRSRGNPIIVHGTKIYFSGCGLISEKTQTRR